MGVSDFETDLIKNLEVKKGHYSEVFYIQENKRAVLRIIPDKMGYWLCTSDAKDKSILKNLKRKHPNLDYIELIQKIN